MVAYGRRMYPRRNNLRMSASSTRSSIAKKTSASGNTAVKRVYKKANTVPKTKVQANKSAIATLARQVKTLQLKEEGQYQKNLEHCEVTGGTIAWNTVQPICFALNNFLEHSQVFIGHDDADLHLPAHAEATHWVKTNPPSLYPEYSYWDGANDDNANPEAYKPIGTTITFNVEAPSLSPNQVYWCRIDIVKPKKILQNTNIHKLGLPQNIQSLSHLANDDMNKRNRYNREYFQVIKTKWIKLENKNEVNKTIEKFTKMYFKFPEKSTCTKLGAGEAKITASGSLDTTFFSQMPLDEVYWCILSTSNASGNSDSNHVKLQMNRFISYRDRFGYST